LLIRVFDLVFWDYRWRTKSFSDLVAWQPNELYLVLICFGN